MTATTTLTPREIDAKLAEAIGCKVLWLFEVNGHWYRLMVENGPLERRTKRATCACIGWRHGDDTERHFLHGYFTAPTWETSGQLIEWFGSRPGELRADGTGGLAPDPAQRRFDDYLHARYWYSNLTPDKIAEAARIALGIPEPTAE